jgi:hypothetical protein
MLKRLVIMAAVLLFGCDNPVNVTGPSPTPAPIYDDLEPIEPAPDMRADTAPDLHQVVGVTAFALALQDESYIHSFIQRVMDHGYNTIRVLSETGGWVDNNLAWLPPGPPINSPEAKKNLKRVLRVAAQYPNLWVEVVVGATYRDDHRATTRWAGTVAQVCQPYKNVFISAMNEPQMSNWTNRELNELMELLRRKSGKLVGVDQPYGPGRYRFPRDLRVDFRGMHPNRNPDPTVADLRNVARLNGLTLFDETNCYLTDWEADTWNLRGNSLFYLNGYGTEQDRQKAAKQNMNKHKEVRQVRWFFHSLELIRCETLDFWLPRWR